MGDSRRLNAAPFFEWLRPASLRHMAGSRPFPRIARRHRPYDLRSRGLAICLPLLCLASACAQYRPEPLSAAMQAEALENRSLDEARLRSFIAASLEPSGADDRAPWNLARLTVAALYFHPDFEIARSKLALARASAVTAAQYPNPTFSANTIISPFSISPAIDFLVETFGRREYRTAQAQTLIEAAREDLATATWQVRGRVRTALFNLWIAEQHAALYRQRLSFQDQLVQLLERRLEEGEASQLDVTRERINRNQVSLALREAERQDAATRAELATAVGVPLRAFDGVTFSYDAFDRAPPLPAAQSTAELRRQALTDRTDVNGLLAQYQAAEAAVQLEIAKQYPNITLGPGYEYEPGKGEYEFAASFAAELPVFHQNQGAIAEAEARRRGVAAQFAALQSQIFGAVDRALTDYRTATATVATAEALFIEAQRRQDQISRSFQAGEADRPTLVAAEIERAAAELSRFDASVQQREAIGTLEDVLQRPLFEPEAKFFVPEQSPLLTPESKP